MDLRERVFKKMGNDSIVELPEVETSWEVCAQYLMNFLQERGYVINIRLRPHSNRSFLLLYNPDRQDAWYSDSNNLPESHPDWWEYEVEIINNNIALAACEAFMEVEL